MAAAALNTTANILLEERDYKLRSGSVAKLDRPEPLARCRLFTQLQLSIGLACGASLWSDGV